jgi:hypothetical protein
MKKKSFEEKKRDGQNTPGRIVTRIEKKLSMESAPLSSKSELQTRIRVTHNLFGRSFQKCRHKQNKTRVREPVLFLIEYRTDVESTKIVTRMLLTWNQNSHCIEGHKYFYPLMPTPLTAAKMTIDTPTNTPCHVILNASLHALL